MLRNARESELQQNTNLQQNTVLQQIKANWVQDPFDLVNIIWPTKAQILLYKRVRVKTNKKKHNKKKQGTAESVNSRNCMKERKVKPKEMMNTIGNA